MRRLLVRHLKGIVVFVAGIIASFVGNTLFYLLWGNWPPEVVNALLAVGPATATGIHWLYILYTISPIRDFISLGQHRQLEATFSVRVDRMILWGMGWGLGMPQVMLFTTDLHGFWREDPAILHRIIWDHVGLGLSVLMMIVLAMALWDKQRPRKRRR